MAKLTDAEVDELRMVVARPHKEPPLPPDDRFVAPNPEARLRYIRWVTVASKFFKGDKPIRFDGTHWRL